MARRARKHHVQENLFRRGGKRRGAGRPPKGERAGSDRQRRPELHRNHPLHITLRLCPEVGNLRRDAIYSAVRAASEVAAHRGRIQIVQLSIQSNHLHLIVEAATKAELAAGMQGFNISLARNINTVLGEGHRRRRGRVLADRYHAVVISSPRQARHVLIYVMNNWRRHGEDRAGVQRGWLLDRFSSGCSFAGWQELAGEPPRWALPAGYQPLVVSPPRTWFLQEGWKLHGAISARAVPGAHDRAAAKGG